MNYVEAMRLDDVSASISSDWLCLRDFAKIHAGLGNKEKAMELLQQCLEQREWQLVFLKG